MFGSLLTLREASHFSSGQESKEAAHVWLVEKRQKALNLLVPGERY
jgi:hypothetical protein